MKKFWVMLLVGLLVLTVGLVVGCGGEEATTTTGAGETTTTAGGTGTTATTGGAASGEDIPVGVILPYSGEMGAFGTPMYNAAKMAAEDINAAGGVLGRPISVSTEDDRSSVEEGIKAARKMIGVTKVVAIAGPFSDILMGVLPVAKAAGVFVCSEAAGTSKLDNAGGDFYFRTVASDTFEGRVAPTVLNDLGIKKLAIMYENDEGRISIAQAVRAQVEKLSMEIAADVQFNPKQTTYAAELAKVAESNPEAVWLGAGQESASTIIKEAYQRGYKWQWILSSDLPVPELFTLIGVQQLEGVLSDTPAADESSPAFQDWASRFQAKFNDSPTGGFQSNSYDQIIVLALAMQLGGEASGAAINTNYRAVGAPPGTKVYTYAEGLAALKKGEEIDYDGVSGPVDFDQNGNVAGSYQALKAVNGEWTVLRSYSAAELGQ